MLKSHILILPIFNKTNILFFFLLSAQAITASNLDSLNNLLRDEQQQSNHQKEVALLIQIGQEHINQNDFEAGLAILENALPKAKKIKNWEDYQTISTIKARALLSTRQVPEAIEALLKLIEDLESLRDGTPAAVYSELAEIYRKIGNNELAYEYHLSGLYIYEEEKDSINIARSFYRIGSIFFYQDNYEIALENYQKALDICDATKLERRVFSCLSAIGGTYNRMAQLEKSLEYNQRAYKLGKKLGLKSKLAYAIMNLGGNYEVMGDTQKALIFYEEALAMHREMNDQWGMCGTLRTIGAALMHKGKYEKSFGCLKEAKDIAERMGYRPRLAELHRTMAFYYEKIEDYKQTSIYLEKYARLKDSLANEASLQKMSDSKTRYETIRKEKALALKDAEFAAQQRSFLLFGLGILTISLWLLYRQNKFKTKNNKVLAEKNAKIQAQNEELARSYAKQKETNEKIKEQNHQLEQSNIELKRYAYIASHDLKEPLRTIGSYANLLQRRYRGKLDNDADEFLNYITSSAKHLYHLLNDVLHFSKLEFGKNEWILTDTNDAIKIANENLKKKIIEKNATVTIGKLPKVTADKLHLVQLFQNLIDNSIKYSDKTNPLVEINSNQKNGFYEFSIKDNGIGIDAPFQHKIFEMFKRLHNREQYDGNGIGLAVCKKIVQQYGGEIWVESSAEKGSTFYFTLPVPEQG